VLSFPRRTRPPHLPRELAHSDTGPKPGPFGTLEIFDFKANVGRRVPSRPIVRGYRWSSYRAYAGETSVPAWLECDKVLGLDGGARAEQRRRYRKYVEDVVREGLPQTPWESVKEQAVLGGAEFLAALKKGLRFDLQEQRRGRRLLAERPSLAAVIQAVEALKDEKWDQFRDRHADRGRDLVLYLGRKLCGLKLAELAEAVELRNYAVVGTSVQRYERSLASIPAEKANLKKVLQMLNCEI
jgi:hypothetical protein